MKLNNEDLKEKIAIKWTKEYRLEYARHYYLMMKQNAIQSNRFRVNEFIQNYYNDHNIILTWAEAEKKLSQQNGTNS